MTVVEPRRRDDPVMTRSRENAAIPVSMRFLRYRTLSIRPAQPCGNGLYKPFILAVAAAVSRPGDDAVMTRKAVLA